MRKGRGSEYCLGLSILLKIRTKMRIIIVNTLYSVSIQQQVDIDKLRLWFEFLRSFYRSDLVKLLQHFELHRYTHAAARCVSPTDRHRWYAYSWKDTVSAIQ